MSISPRSLLWLLLSIIPLHSHKSPAICHVSMDDTITALRADLRSKFDASGVNKPLIGTSVRLAFHDCGGAYERGMDGHGASICDGCLNFYNPGHFGLASAVEALEQVYQSYNEIMSRADFWAAAGTIALEYAQQLDGMHTEDRLPAIPFYFGRRDCMSSPYGKAFKEFPDALKGWDASYAWFRDNFGLDVRETIAAFGAHTLGQAHVWNSGFSSMPWVTQPYVLDNYYYYSMVFDTWYQRLVNCETHSLLACKYEWQEQTGRFLMFNSDMCLFYDVEPDADGKVECGAKSTRCRVQPDYVSQVTMMYASDNQLWLTDFAKSWEIMITAGYDRSKLGAYYVPY